MSKSTGISIHMYTSQKELNNAKNGASILLASKVKTKENDIHISAPLDACDILDNEVRVNLSLFEQIQEELRTKLGETVGEAMGNAMGKALQDELSKLDG